MQEQRAESVIDRPFNRLFSLLGDDFVVEAGGLRLYTLWLFDVSQLVGVSRDLRNRF